MKKVWYSIAALAIVVVIGLVFWVQNSEAQAPWRSNTESEAEQKIPAVVDAPDTVIVDALVTPEREANLSMAASGIVAEVLVDEGAIVTAGQPLLRLESTRQAAAVAQAQANLLNAELKLAELQAPPRAEEIERYQASVSAAQAQLQDVLDGPSSTEIAAAQADLANAEAARRQAQSDYDEVSWRTDVGMLPQATALEQATNNYVAAQARLDDLLDGATQAQVASASAQVTSAQAELDLLLAGAESETIAAAEANIAAAQATLQDAQAALDQMTLKAPFAGTVGSINVEVGEQLSPGMAAVQLADLSEWHIQTDDLTELAVVKVQPGDRADISIDALPELDLTGRVTSIKPVGESKQGDIIYTVLIELDDQDERLYWNMTAQATIVADEAGRAAAHTSEPQTVADYMQNEVTAQDETVTPVDIELMPASAIQSDAPAAITDADKAEPDMTATVQTGGANLNVRAGPATTYDIVGKAQPGEALAVQARNESGDWVLILLPDGEQGWVSADYVTVDGTITELPTSTFVGESVSADESTQVDESANQVNAVQPILQGSAAPLSAATSTERIAGLSGTLVFQSSSGGTIYAYDMADGALWPVTTGADPALSPDGGTVAFVRGGGEAGLYLVDIDGENERRIYNGGEGLRTPSWSPDGQEIVFSRVIGESTCRSVATSICVEDNAFLDGFPLQSSDLRGLSRVDINGENFRDIATLNTAAAPNWNEAGIVYASSAGIQVIEDLLDDENRAVAADFTYADPDWQPNGGRIVFQSQEGNHRELMIVEPDGSNAQFLTRPTNLLASAYPQNVAPVWSPDGAHIAFLSNRTESGTAGEWAIWVMDADGENLQRLPIDVEIEYNFQNEAVLDWS